MRGKVIALLALLTFASCASLRKFEKIQLAAETVRSVYGVGIGVITAKCRQEAVQCHIKRVTDCKPLRKCQDIRRKFVQILIVVVQTLAVARTYMLDGKAGMAGVKIKEALKLLDAARAIARQYGLEA